MFWNALQLALRAIRRNLLRSCLTTLGIVIGVASVIVMFTIGAGTTAQVRADVSTLGSNLLIVSPGQMMGPGGHGGAKPFKLKDAESMTREIPSVAVAAPSSSRRVKAVFANKGWRTQVTGSDDRYFQARGWSLERGRFFAEGEIRGGRAVCILGHTVVRELFGEQDPLNSKIRLGKVSCQIIGVLMSKGQTSLGMDQDDIVLMPLHTFWRRIAGNRDVGIIQVSVKAGIPTEKAQKDITALMRERRRIAPTEDNDFTVMDMKEIATVLTGITKAMTALLGAVATVSLLVGGIGIMNIMLVSVTERTREIGIRLAIGAYERDVLMQFLVEAMVLSSFGGLIGILLALLGSFGLSRLLRVPFIFDVQIVLLAFLFSAAVGIVFGYLPARKAARLNPIDALRHE